MVLNSATDMGMDTATSVHDFIVAQTYLNSSIVMWADSVTTGVEKMTSTLQKVIFALVFVIVEVIIFQVISLCKHYNIKFPTPRFLIKLKPQVMKGFKLLLVGLVGIIVTWAVTRFLDLYFPYFLKPPVLPSLPIE